MANRITEMTAASTLTGDELIEVSQLSPTVTISATTISAANADSSFNDSGSGFVSAGFAVGDRVKVEGFTESTNNLFFGVIATLTAAKMTIEAPEGSNIIDEAAGDSVTITKWTTRRTTGQAVGDLGGSGAGGIDIEDDGTLVQLDATVLNFTGSGVSVTDGGGYQVDIDIPGGGGGDGALAEFKGALVTKSTTQSLLSSTTTALTFDTEEYDTSGFHDNVTNNSRLTVPAGVSRVRVSGMVTRQTTANQLYADIAKNGSDFIGKGEADTDTSGSDSVNVISAIVDVSPGDYFELRAFASTSSTLEAECWFAIEAIYDGSIAAETITESGSSANLLNANRGKYQRWTGTGAKTLTVQPNATEAITQDAEFHITNRATSGDLTIAAGSGVTINPPADGSLILLPGMMATLKRVASDEFDLIGQTDLGIT